MDFSKHDSRTAAEAGRKVQILNQETGEPIYDGDTQCCFFIRGNSSRSVQAAIKAEQAAKMKASRNAKVADDNKTLEDIHEKLVTAAARLITAFSGVQRVDDGTLRDLTTSADDLKWFLDLNFLSMDHLMRKQALTKDEDETPADFAERQKVYEAQWHRPSFAQQVLEAAQDDADFLRQTSQG